MSQLSYHIHAKDDGVFHLFSPNPTSVTRYPTRETSSPLAAVKRNSCCPVAHQPPLPARTASAVRPLSLVAGLVHCLLVLLLLSVQREVSRPRDLHEDAGSGIDTSLGEGGGLDPHVVPGVVRLHLSQHRGVCSP